MALFAAIKDGAIVARREIGDYGGLPDYKKAALAEDGGRSIRPIIFEGEGPLEEEIIEKDQVRIVRSDYSLDDIKKQLIARVNEDAERIRLRYLTPGQGKMLAYTELREESASILVDNKNPVDVDVSELGEGHRDVLEKMYPLMSAEIPYQGSSYLVVAQVVQARYVQFRLTEKAIITTVRSAETAINDAQTPSEARSAYASIQWTV